MSLYQLSIPAGTGATHVPFVYFSNGKAGPDQFCIAVTHRILPPRERNVWADRIVRYCGEAALGRRVEGTESHADVKLEFMRYAIVWCGEGPPTVVCMDTLCDAAGSERELADARPALTAVDVQEGDGMSSTVPTSTDRACRWRDLHFKTTTHGDVRVRLSVFRNPDLRNGIRISPTGVVTRDNAWGGVVRPIHPKRLMLRHFTRAPPPLPRNCASCADANQSDYYESTTGHFFGHEGEHTMMVPRGGAGRGYKIEM